MFLLLEFAKIPGTNMKYAQTNSISHCINWSLSSGVHPSMRYRNNKSCGFVHVYYKMSQLSVYTVNYYKTTVLQAELFLIFASSCHINIQDSI